MENRSFDHMLGYLSLTGGRADIDGLRPGLANEYQGRSYPVHHLATTKVDVDPDHTASAVDVQVDGGRMGGFVASLAATIADSRVHGGDPSPAVGYYDGADVPVYDHLAEEFLVCDRWFSSVPGATWPNRLYALCGSAAGGRDDLPPHVPPIYHKPSFVRHLDEHGVSWRWYCFDTPTLRLAGARYTAGHHHHFGYFSKTGLSWKTKLEIRIDARAASFLEDAASGSLPSVSWIDPAFTSFNPLGFRPNDDHAPADIRDGQDLVLAVYDALATSPAWERSLLVIVCVEHRLRSHLDHQVGSAPLLPRGSGEPGHQEQVLEIPHVSSAASRRPGGPRRPSRRTLDPHCATAGAAAGPAGHGRRSPGARTSERRQRRNRSSGPGGACSHRPAEGLPRGGSRAGQMGAPGRQALTSGFRPAARPTMSAPPC